MSVFVVGSVHGSPGASTVSMLLAAVWPEVSGRAAVVVEADLDGGTAAARFEELRTDRTLADVAVVSRRVFDTEVLVGLSRRVWGSVPVVPAPCPADQVASALTAGGARLASALGSLSECDVFVDAGRVRPGGPLGSLLAEATVVLVCRPRFEDVVVVGPRVQELTAAGVTTRLVCVGSQPYDPAEVAVTVGAPLVGVVADDPRTATVLCGGSGSDRRVRRSHLWRSATDLASGLVVEVSADAVPHTVPAPDVEDAELGDERGEVAV